MSGFKLKQILLCLCLLLILASCGRKTPPQAYKVERLNFEVEALRVYFRGEQLRVTASAPKEAKIEAVKLVVLAKNPDCSLCKPEQQQVILFSVLEGVVLESGANLTQKTISNQIQWQLNPSFEVLLPKDYFPSLQGQLSFKLIFLGQAGGEVSSRSVTAYQPKAIPPPKIRLDKTTEGNIALWQGAESVFGDDLFIGAGFGVNFYLITAEGEEKLNQYPQRSGHFAIPRGKVKAYQVDANGNESQAVWVSQESLAPTP